MTIQFSKPGSTLWIGATALLASTGLCFGSPTYAQTVPAAKTATSAQDIERILNERDYRFSQLPTFEQQSASGRLQSEPLRSNLLRSSARRKTQQKAVTPVTRPASIQSQGTSGLSSRTAQQLLENVSPTQKNPTRSRASIIVSESYPNVSKAAAEVIGRITTTPQPVVAAVAFDDSTVAQANGVHQLQAISIVVFEQKLLSFFGDQLTATSSGDGRFVRVSMQTGTASDSMVMLVDRETGKLQYEGADALTAEWHQLISKFDSAAPLVKPAATADLQSAFPTMPQPIKQVAFQQEGQQLGTPVQGVDGLKGQVFIVPDPNGGGITISGDPEDVETVKREIARLSALAKSSQPTPASIPLENARGNLIQERVQEIYDASYSQLNGPANITATDSPNALVVVGTPEAVQAVRSLIKVLDVKPEEGSTKDFRTFSLKYISAPDAADRLRRFFGQVTVADDSNRIPATAVEVIPDFRSNQVTVKGGQTILNSAAEFLQSIDVASVENGAVNEVRVIPLRNALASDVALVIQNAINGQLPNAGQAFAPQSTNQNPQQNNVTTDSSGTQSQLRSAMLSFMTRNEQGELIRSGILFDVRVTADANSNSLIVTGPAQSIPLIVELVKQLDRIPDAESQIKVFELVYSDAESIFNMLDTLFNNDNQDSGQQAGGASNLPLQTGGGSDGASLINLRFSIEPRSNAIIASGPARDLQVIEDLLNRLDARAVNNSPAQVYRLSNAPAQDVADAINTYLAGRSDIIDADPRTATGVPAVNRAITVTPEVVSNSLIVSALPEYLGEIENIIRSLDRRPPMVHIKVLIAEVDLNAVEEFGSELGIQDSLLFDRGTSIVENAVLSGTGDNLAGQALSTLGVGRVNTALGFGGLVLSAGNESVNILLRALKDRQCMRVLSKPQIMTMENLQGRVSIGASVARISGTNTTNFGLTQDITFEDVGIILEVTPRVSPDGLIVLSVNTENSSVGSEASGTAVGTAADGSIIFAQPINRTAATTTLSARSGQTVVFSGLISEQKSHTERGTPILSDLPVIGPLFSFKSDSSSRTELLIIMTPTLVTDDNDLTNLNHEAMDRMHWCMSDVADVYGSTDYGSGVELGAAVETFYPDADPTGTMQSITRVSEQESPDQPVSGNEADAIVAERQAPPTKAKAQSARRSRWNPFSRR